MPKNAIIRDATDNDAAAVQAIYAPYVIETSISFEMEPPSVDEMKSRMQRATDRFPWLVMERDSEILGYAYATQFRAREAYRNSAESSVYISQNHQRQGIGRQLMEELINRLRIAKHHRVIAGATLPNPGSAGLHESLGFRPVGVFSEIGYKFDKWHDVGFWELRLSDTET